VARPCGCATAASLGLAVSSVLRHSQPHEWVATVQQRRALGWSCRFSCPSAPAAQILGRVPTHQHCQKKCSRLCRIGVRVSYACIRILKLITNVRSQVCCCVAHAPQVCCCVAHAPHVCCCAAHVPQVCCCAAHVSRWCRKMNAHMQVAFLCALAYADHLRRQLLHCSFDCRHARSSASDLSSC
jgi:hypothetical protein